MEGLGSDTGEVAVEALPGTGVGATEVALDADEVVLGLKSSIDGLRYANTTDI